MTPRMADALLRLGEGWTIWKGMSSFAPEATLQPPADLERQGEQAERFDRRTFEALRQRGLLLCYRQDYPTAFYRLSAAGRDALAELGPRGPRKA